LARRFQFRLQTLLRVRQLEEQQAKRKVAARRAEIAQLDHLNRQTADEILRQQEALLREQRQGRLDPGALQRGRAWVAYLRRQIAQRHLQRAELERGLQELRAAWQHARTRMRAVETLRERRHAAYLKQRERQEQAAADELARQLLGYEQL
jgi:flagellar export protein FliJ